MLIIAFDLSLKNSGWAVGKVVAGELTVIDYGSISTSRFSKRPTGMRLAYIAQELKALYRKYPEAVKVVKERSFSNSKITASQQIQKVNGVWEMVSHLAGYEEFTEFAPTTVKKELTGNGKATKEEVCISVQELTGVSSLIDDETDAVAVLYTYCKKEGLLKIAV